MPIAARHDNISRRVTQLAKNVENADSDGVDTPSFPFKREHGYEPPPIEAQLRHECPISKVKLFDGNEAWAFTKHKDICEALKSPHLSAVI